MEILTRITKICIDDFALKKRHRYGTIIVDVETHRIIDMIESRDQSDVAKWLSKFPNIKVVSRDGSSQYAAAINQAHPDAIQVSDRFHLIRNLTDHAKQHMAKVVSANFRILDDKEKNVNGGYWDKSNCHEVDFMERRHTANTEKKRVLVGKVRSLSAQGLSITSVAKETGLSHPTVRKYLNLDFNPANSGYGSNKASLLKPYTEVIDVMLENNHKFKEIEAILLADGYKGSISTIRMYARRKRRILNDLKDEGLAKTTVIKRKWLNKLLYKPIGSVKEITECQLEKIVQDYPLVGILYDIVQSFKEIVSAKRVDELDAWLEYAVQFDIDEINSFINGIKLDLEAVKNAIRYEYNNGLAEGSINKLKAIKRIMYGRCSFNLLRNKILLQE